MSVNVITSKMLDRMGIKDLQDITKLDPSLVFVLQKGIGYLMLQALSFCLAFCPTSGTLGVEKYFV